MIMNDPIMFILVNMFLDIEAELEELDRQEQCKIYSHYEEISSTPHDVRKPNHECTEHIHSQSELRWTRSS